METWKAITGYEGIYEVSDFGRVRSAPRGGTVGGILRATRNTGGYVQVILSINGKRRVFRVHALVLSEFVGPRAEEHECCHINGDRADNRLANLRYDTKSANYADRRHHGTANDGARNGRAKLTLAQVDQIRRLMDSGVSNTYLASIFGVSGTQIARVKSGAQWNEVA